MATAVDDSKQHRTVSRMRGQVFMLRVTSRAEKDVTPPTAKNEQADGFK